MKIQTCTYTQTRVSKTQFDIDLERIRPTAVNNSYTRQIIDNLNKKIIKNVPF